MKKPPTLAGIGGGNSKRSGSLLLIGQVKPISPEFQDPDTLPIAAQRQRAWWRASLRRRLTPAELSLIVIDGGRDG